MFRKQKQQHPKRPAGFLRVNLPKIAAAGSGQVTIAAVTGYISYGHVKALTMALGEPEKYANVWPLGVDGMVVACSVMVLTAKRDKTAAKAGVALGIAQSVAANLAYGWTDVNGKLGWPAHAAGAAWSALIALGFAITCISLERWIAGLVADWREAHERAAGHAGPVTPAVPALIPTPAVAPGVTAPAACEPARPAAEADPVPKPPVTPEPAKVTPAPVAGTDPVKSPAQPAAVQKPPAVKREQQQKQQPGDGPPRTCCAAHRALDSGGKLDREQALAVYLEHRAVHRSEPRFRDLGGGSLEQIFGMGSKPARELRTRLNEQAGSALAQVYPGSTTGAEPGLNGAGVDTIPADPGSTTPAQSNPGSPEPGSATPARTGPDSTPAQPVAATPAPVYPGSAGIPEPGSEDAKPAPALMAGSGVAS